jgi:CHAT domain
VPASAARVAADAALVVSLGDPGRLELSRLHELGAAMVDAAVAVHARELATVVHGSGVLGVPMQTAARALAEGLMRSLARTRGPSDVREIQLVVRRPEDARAVHRALRGAHRPSGLALTIEPGVLELPALTGAVGENGAASERVHLALTRLGDELKATLITEGAFDTADNRAYPTAKVDRLLHDVTTRVLRGGSDASRARAMRDVGSELHDAFLAGLSFDADAPLRRLAGGCVLLRLDESTVDLPWELARVGRRFLALGWTLARQREITAPGHPAAYVTKHARLRALVIGDPLDNLPGAREEAIHVTKALKARGAAVTHLGSGATVGDVLQGIDEHNPDVLHYAGHAQFDPLRQQAGGLVLADGILTAADLEPRPHLPRLFFANACQAAATGTLADQQIADGAAPTNDFAGGVLRGGARALIGSQWVVDDVAARTFAERFYGHLAKDAATTIGDAVTAARRGVVDKHGLGEPAWAGYALYGAPWSPAL